MSRKNMDIVYICDEKYVLSTLISVRSIKKSGRQGWHYHVTVIADGLSAQSIDAILAEADRGRLTISVCKNSDGFGDILFEHSYVSRSALLKFQLPSILSELDTVLYVDGDILFRKGFEDITGVQIDDVYAAVVKDMPTYDWNHRQELGLKEYFNSGVMYLNLEKMRNDKTQQKLWEYKKMEQKHLFMDQDAFNVVFHDNVLFLHPGYNCIGEVLRSYTSEHIASFYNITPEGAVRLADSACILHMAGKKKPWNDIESEQLEEWTSYINDFGELVKWERNFIFQLNRKYQDGNDALQENRRELEKIREENRQLETVVSRQIVQEAEALNAKISELEVQEHTFYQNSLMEIAQIKDKIVYLENLYSEDRHRFQQMYTDLNARTESMERWIILRIYKAVRNRLFKKKR